jgi:hypothetical protein
VTGRQLIASILVLPAVACTGASFGENGPGDGDGDGPSLGTYLENGSIAVDGTNENVFVLSTETDSDTLVETKELLVAGPQATRARRLAQLTGLEDLRLLFTGDRIMVMGEAGTTEELIVYDRAASAEIDRRTAPGRYHGTRVSGSGDFVVVADNDEDKFPLHVIRAGDLSITQIPHDGDWLEANWVNNSDRLLAAVFYGPKFGSGPADGSARIMSWSISSLAADNFPIGADNLWINPQLDVTIENADLDLLFSFSWLSVSPDDRYAVVPMVHRDEGEVDNRHRLAVITLATGEVRMVDDARGPVGFTPDGSTIVSYRSATTPGGDAATQLLLLDAESLEGELLDEPSPGLIQYFVTRENNFVVVGDFFGSSELTLVDLDNGKTTRLGRAIDLNEFVSRPGTGQLYLVDQGLFRLDVFAATLEEVPLAFEPAHINRLPSDQLVVDNPSADELVFLDPDSGDTNRRVSLD